MSAAPRLSESPLRIEGVRGATALDTALALLRAGFHPTVTYPADAGAEGKNPIGAAWGLDRPTEGQVRNRFRVEPRAGVGICMGPGKAPGGRWLVDCEGDGPEAEASLLKLTDGEDVETMGWKSARGRHRLFVVGDDFLDAIVRAGGAEGEGASGKATYHLEELPGLEIRVGGRKSDGTVKQVHSACPPTLGTDGEPRAWTGPEHVAELPDAATAFLEALAERRAIQCEDDPPGTLSMEAAREAFAIRAPSATAVEAYTRAGVDAELKILAETTKGTGKHGGRNGQLNASAFSLGQFVAAGVLSEAEAEAGLLAACHANGLRDGPDVTATLRSGLTAGKAQPRDLSGVGTKSERPAAKGRAAEPPPVIDLATATDADLGIIPLKGVKPRRVNWLWPDRLAEGEFSLLAGEGGLGKSQMLLKIAAALSRGDEWPDWSGRAPLGRTFILAAEDDPATTIVPRLMAMGADLDMIDVVSATHVVRAEGKAPVVHHDSLQDLDVWMTRMDRRAGVKLLIVDPLPSYLGRGVNDSKNAELRAVLEPFVDQVTRPRGVCMLANSHLNKSTDSRTPIHRINGSVAYANLARSVSFVLRDPDDAAHRIFTQVKCNIAPDNLPSIGFRIETKAVQTDDGEIETAVPIFDAAPIDGFDVHDAMAPGKGSGTRGPAPTKRVDLAVWLVEQMKEQGPILFAKLVDEAGEAGFLGAENADGRYQGLTNLYRARDYVPKLPEPHAGWEIVTSREDGSLMSSNGKHRWLMKAVGSSF